MSWLGNKSCHFRVTKMVNLSIFLLSFAFSAVFGTLTVRYEWKYMDFDWENSQAKQNAVDSGRYRPSSILPIDVQSSRDGRIFVTNIRLPGSPATLSIVTDKTGEGGPLLRPYPNWDWNSRTDCEGIWDVMRVAVDECNRLYVLDNGVDMTSHICPAQLLIFDLSNDSLIKRITIPKKYAANAKGYGSLNNLAVETQGSRCQRTWVYMSDVTGRGLVVWDGNNLRRFESDTFEAVPKYTKLTIAGETMELNDGIFSVALRPKKYDWESTDLYYRPLASLNQYFVRTDQLKCQVQPDYQTMNYTFPTQVTVEAFSRDGIMFFALTGTTAIGCWDSNKPMNDENVVTLVQDEETLQFASAIKVTREQLWVLTNSYQKGALGTRNLNDVNFRILHDPNLSHLVKGTNCQVKC